MQENPLVILIGGSGYTGTHFMLELHGKQVPGQQEGIRYQIAIVDRQEPILEALKLAEKRADGLEVIVRLADILERQYPVMPRVPYCGIMLAAHKDVNEGERLAYTYMRDNIALSVNSMEYLTQLGTQRLIQASSSAVYHTERDNDMPIGVYGYTKRITEDICRKLMTPTQQFLIARYMNPIGSHSEVQAFSLIGLCKRLSEMKDGDTFVNRGDCIRDYIHVTDLATFHADALEAWDTTLFPDPENRVVTLDVGTGVSTSTADIVRLFEIQTGLTLGKITTAERLHHEGYDTVRVSEQMKSLIPKWWGRSKTPLADSLRDYSMLSTRFCASVNISASSGLRVESSVLLVS
jgi:UDP-glucose 4-epimerase